MSHILQLSQPFFQNKIVVAQKSINSYFRGLLNTVCLMKDRKPDFCDTTLTTKCFYYSINSDDQHKVTENSQKPNAFLDLLCKIADQCIPNPSIEHEKEYQRTKAELKQQSNEHCEVMFTLSVIDAKAQSLLSYISISIAVFAFILSELQTNTFIKYIILSMLFLLSIAMLLCLYCVDIIGAHTIKCLKSKEKADRLNEYNDHIFKLALQRRKCYIIAHRLSIVAAFLCILFMVLLIFTLR